MLIHDFAPTGLIRTYLSNLFNYIQWQYVVTFGFVGVGFTALSLYQSFKVWRLVFGLVSLAICLFFYGLMNGNMGGM